LSNLDGALITFGGDLQNTSVRNERAPIASPIEALNFSAVSSTRRLATGASPEPGKESSNESAIT